MRISEVMQTEVQTIPPDARVSDAAIILADARVSALPVVEEGGALVGVISATDILSLEEEAGGQGRGRIIEHTMVREVMTPEPLTISPDDDIREAARRMLDSGVHRLIVTTAGHIMGVISTSDILRAVASGQL
jgi:CBS domain-containing protein